MPSKGVDTTATLLDASPYIVKHKATQIDYSTFSSRIKTEYSDGNQSLDFTIVLRMKKDSAIWLSLQGPFGIEGARILITADTIRYVNHLMSEYLCQPTSYVSHLLPIQPSMKMLQDFILGYYLSVDGINPDYRGLEDSLHLIQAENATTRYRAWLHPQNYTLTKSLLADMLAGQQITTIFDGYMQEQGKPYSSERTMTIQQTGRTMKLQLHYTKIKINEPVSMPFDIDRNMKQVENIRF